MGPFLGRSLAFACGAALLAAEARAAAPVPSFSVIHSFGDTNRLGGEPQDGIIVGRDGVLYGTTTCCSARDGGTVFRMNRDGSGYAVLHHFESTGFGPSGPRGALLDGNDGLLYGTSFADGTNHSGLIFRLRKDGAGYTVLHNFTARDGDGVGPFGGLVEGSGGALYSTTYGGGEHGCGTLFTLKKDGNGYRVLRSFSLEESSGVWGTLVWNGDDRLFGLGVGGGADGKGTVFEVRTDGTEYRLLHRFSSGASEGIYPHSLILGTDGFLYGTTLKGGTAEAGTIFKIGTDGTGYQVLRRLNSDAGEGRRPSSLAEASDGRLYGTAGLDAEVHSVLFRIEKDGSHFEILHRFGATDGVEPVGSLAESGDGVLLGVASRGGRERLGTVFELNKNGGGFRVLWSFSRSGGAAGIPCALSVGRDGSLYGGAALGGSNGFGTLFAVGRNGSDYHEPFSFPVSTNAGASWDGMVFEGSDGALYGTTAAGGAHGSGTLFRVSKDGTGHRVLWDFLGADGGGARPSVLFEGSDGMLYGTTVCDGPNGCGTVFKIHKDGSGYRVLASPSHSVPWFAFYLSAFVTLVEGRDGALYGTSGLFFSIWDGFETDGTNDYGDVFTLNKDGSGYRVLRNFDGGFGDGKWPNHSLIEGSDEVLYGTTASGGTNYSGTLYQLNKDGSGYRALRTFEGTSGFGFSLGQILEGRDGALYGTTEGSGVGCPDSSGSIFKMNKDGTGYATLWCFTRVDGQYPQGLRLGSDGALYGFTQLGGEANAGVLFRLGHALSLSFDAADHVTLALTGIPGYTYELQRSTDLRTWTTVQSLLMSDTPILHYEDTNATAGAAFFRLRVP